MADAETFLADILLCLPVVGVSFFEKVDVAEAKGCELVLRAKGIEGRGLDAPQGFVVRAGSTAVKAEVPSILNFIAELRRTLIEKSILEDIGETYRLTQDYTFASPRNHLLGPQWL